MNSDQSQAVGDEGKKQARSRGMQRSIIEMLLLTLLMLLVIRFAVQNYQVQGVSMEPSLHNQEYILVDKVSYLFQHPSRGDVIVFRYPVDPSENFVKRIIAVPGDTISVVGEQVTVDGVVLNEPYINSSDRINPFPSFKNRILANNEYFVMGDNRGNSSDSRDWGAVPSQNIIGKATLIFWPLGEHNSGLLPDVSNVFAHVRP